MTGVLRPLHCALVAMLALCAALAHAQGGLTASAQCPPQAPPASPEATLEAAERASDRGVLWRISKAGRSSYLYGTLHVGKLDWTFPGPQTRAALAASDTIALELDVMDPQVRERLRLPADAAVPALPPALRERLDRQIDAACVPRESLATQHPVMVAMTLSVLAARWEGLDPGYGQEFVLAAFARSSAKVAVSLETPELQMDTLLPKQPTQAERMIVQSLEQLESGGARKVIARMASAWERGALDELADYEKWCDCVASADDRALLARINDERNPGLAERIDALHAQGKALFAAVGALHMTGPQALTTLLAARGFRVERVDFR